MPYMGYICSKRWDEVIKIKNYDKKLFYYLSKRLFTISPTYKKARLSIILSNSLTFYLLKICLSCQNIWFYLQSKNYFKTYLDFEEEIKEKRYLSQYQFKYIDYNIKHLKKGMSQSVNLCISLGRPYYVSGQEVSGCVFLQVFKSSKFEKLKIHLDGQQNFSYETEESDWIQKTNSIYHDQFVVHQFDKEFSKGYYQFPFTFTLPGMMCSSFKSPNSGHLPSITYLLKAQISKFKQAQTYVNIIEPPRAPIKINKALKTFKVSRCYNCSSQNKKSLTVLMQCKNFLMDGQSFKLEGYIDNSKGIKPIQNGKIFLKEKYLKEKEYFDQSSTLLHTFDRTIAIGEKYEFSLDLIFPQCDSYTAIGNLVARLFFIEFIHKKVTASITVFVHSRTPLIKRATQSTLQSNWSPQVFPTFCYRSLKPFLKRTCPEIPQWNISKGGRDDLAFTDLQKYQSYQPIYQRKKQEQKKKQALEEKLEEVHTENFQVKKQGQPPIFVNDSPHPLIKVEI